MNELTQDVDPSCVRTKFGHDRRRIIPRALQAEQLKIIDYLVKPLI